MSPPGNRPPAAATPGGSRPVERRGYVDEVLAEIERLPGRHLYFLDDHLLGHRRFAATLFAGMRGMGRVFQGASTVNAILDSDLIEQAAQAGMPSLFIALRRSTPRTCVAMPRGSTWPGTTTR